MMSDGVTITMTHLSGYFRSPGRPLRPILLAGTVVQQVSGQPPMYFPLGGGTVKGISKPGHIVWSRIFVEDGRLKADLGLGEVLSLPNEETERRWQSTTHQWPIMHAIIQGVSRREFMARHKANHIQVVYVPDSGNSEEALITKATAFAELGIETFICGMEWT